MKQRDKGKASLVEFLRSIKFSHHPVHQEEQECSTHFAGFQQHARTQRQYSNEDSELVRSAN